MRPLQPLAAALALALAVALPARSGENEASQPAESSAKKTTAKAASDKSSSAAAQPADPGAKPAAQPVPPPPAPATGDSGAVDPVTPTVGERATTFTLDSGEMLGRHVVGVSAGVNKFARAPGSVSVLTVGLDVAVGVTDRISLFLEYDPKRHIHVGRPTELSLNPLYNGCPVVPNTIFADINCGNLTPTAAYVEDFPFANHNGGRVGPLTLGIKANLFSQQRGSSPIALAVRSDFIIPTVTGESSLLSNEVQNGAFDWQIALIASRRWGSNLIETTLNLPFVLTLNPRSGGQILIDQADQFRPGFGFTVFPDKRFQIISEYTAVIFTGGHTPITTFGPRDPVEGVWGVRLYPWRWFAMDLGYRSMFNLNQVSDRHGFVVRLATTIAPKPYVPPPASLSCDLAAADPAAVEDFSGTPVVVSVRANATDSRPLSYSYEASGGRIEGTGPQVRWNYAGLDDGTYTITPSVSGGNLRAVCAPVSVRVNRPIPPRLACSASPSAPVFAGEYVNVTATATDASGKALPYPVTYQWAANGGAVEGSGSKVRLNTTGLSPGSYTVTARAEGKGGAADCNAPVTVKPNIEPAREIARCEFKKFSASVTNACKAPPLDGVPARFNQFPGATLVIEAWADPSETRESASRAMKTKAKAKVAPEEVAKERAANVKTDLTKRLGLPDAAIETHATVGRKGGGAANQTMTITLVPQGAKYEPKAP